MKGLLFQQGIESRLEILGEGFRQGDSISCSLTVKNGSKFDLPTDQLLFALTEADLKKVAKKDFSAYETIYPTEIGDSGVIAPGEQRTFAREFPLDINCIISDSAQSICVVFGLNTGEFTGGQLQVPVTPHADIEGILTVVETSFQFDPRGQKSKSGWVVARLKAPAGGKFKTVDELELGFRFQGDKLQLRYNFKVKRLEAGPSTLAIQKKKLEFKRDLERSDYFSKAGYIDSKLLEPILEETLSRVVSNF